MKKILETQTLLSYDELPIEERSGKFNYGNVKMYFKHPIEGYKAYYTGWHVNGQNMYGSRGYVWEIIGDEINIGLVSENLEY